MKNKKNLLCTLLLAGLLSASLTGCLGGSGNSDNSDNSTGTNSELPGGDVSDDSSEDSTGGGTEVTHKTYEEIAGDPVEVVAPIAEGNVKGYSVKICPCGEELHGDFTVLVTVKLNGAELATQTVKVGAGLAALTLPTRDGYTLKLYKDGKEYALTETFDDFATVELTSRWFYTETDFDYVTDVEARVATLPAEVTVENAEEVLEQIAAIEAIVNMHYTEEEKAGVASLAELKAAAETIVSTSEYQLNKKLSAIPEIEDMTDEMSTLFAVLDYIAYYNGVKDELSDYSEPRKISIYKTYFSGKDATITNLPAKVETNATLEGNNLVMVGAEDNTYTFALPKLPYALFNEFSAITVFGMANTSYTFNAYETTFANTGNAWNWFKVIRVGAEGKTVKNTDTGEDIVLAEGYYFTIGHTDVGSEWYTYVKLSDAVVNGEEALTFTVTTSEGAWDYLTFRQDGSVAASNFVGKLDEIQSEVVVRKVTYSYKDGAGEQTITQYYLDGESLSLPEVDASYTDSVGTHTFSGWGETADVVTGDLTYTATYETVYKTYTVIFLDAEYDVFEEKDGYKYGDKVVLPTATPEKAKEGDWKFEFIGWFNGEDEVTSETKVEKNMEIEPRFKSIYVGACYVLTIESEGMETKTYNIPALTDLQAEALSLIPTLERSGYTFAGYTNKETNETVDIANLTLSSDITIVAKWTAKYASMAAELPASVAEIKDENQTYNDLVAYLSYVANNPVDGYEEPANVTALKAHYAGTRKIYTYVSTVDLAVTGSLNTSIAARADDWYQDDQGVNYDGYYSMVFDLGDGDYTATLTKINYSLYSEVSFGLYTGIAGTISMTINGQTCSSFVSDGFYVVEINGKNLNIHKMNEPANVLLTATLTDAQYNGTEGLTLNVTESGWNCVQISHILGQLAVEKAEEPEIPDAPEGEMAETLLAKLPASVAEIKDENQTYSDLVAYLSFVANNPVDGYEEPANVTALKAHYAGTRKIYTYVSAEDLAVTGSLNTSIAAKGDDWYQDDQGVNYDGYYSMVFDKADGDYTVTLTKINFSVYGEVSFGLYTGIAGTISISINGQTCSSFVSDGFYVVEIHGKNLEIHKMNEPANVLFTTTLTDAQYNGTEALTLNVTESGWNCVQISHILGTLA